MWNAASHVLKYFHIQNVFQVWWTCEMCSHVMSSGPHMWNSSFHMWTESPHVKLWKQLHARVRSVNTSALIFHMWTGVPHVPHSHVLFVLQTYIYIFIEMFDSSSACHDRSVINKAIRMRSEPWLLMSPLTQNSRLSAYSRQRRHLTASSRAIPTGAPPSCSCEPGAPWQHAHCKHTTRRPERRLRRLALIRGEPLLRNCSVRKNSIPLSARLSRLCPASCFSSSGLSVRSSRKLSQQVVSYFPSAPPGWWSVRSCAQRLRWHFQINHRSLRKYAQRGSVWSVSTLFTRYVTFAMWSQLFRPNLRRWKTIIQTNKRHKHPAVRVKSSSARAKTWVWRGNFPSAAVKLQTVELKSGVLAAAVAGARSSLEGGGALSRSVLPLLPH